MNCLTCLMFRRQRYAGIWFIVDANVFLAKNHRISWVGSALQGSSSPSTDPALDNPKNHTSDGMPVAGHDEETGDLPNDLTFQ